MLITILKFARGGPGRPAAQLTHTLMKAWAAQRRRRLEWKAAAELHHLSDYALRDLGVVRSQIDERVRFPPRRSTRARGVGEFI